MIYGWKGICSDNWMLLGVKSKKSRHNGLYSPSIDTGRQPHFMTFFLHLLIYHLMSCSKQAISKEEAMLYFFFIFCAEANYNLLPKIAWKCLARHQLWLTFGYIWGKWYTHTRLLSGSIFLFPTKENIWGYNLLARKINK